jgi:hypothetical protein
MQNIKQGSKNRHFYFYIICVTFTLILNSCASFKDTTDDKNVKSKYNDDNIVFKTGSSFVYEAILIDKTDTLPIHHSSGSLINQVILKVAPGKFFGQTKILWQYANEFTEVANPGTTGVYEDSERIFLHPPRNGFPFIYTECAPFPQIHFPLFKGKERSSTTWVPKNQFEEIKLSGSKVQHKWTVVKKASVEISDSVYNDVWEIYAESESVLGKATHRYYFCEKNGFLKMTYTFPDGRILILELINNKNTL